MYAYCLKWNVLEVVSRVMQHAASAMNHASLFSLVGWKEMSELNALPQSDEDATSLDH